MKIKHLALACASAFGFSHGAAHALPSMPFMAEINGVRAEVFVHEDSGRYSISASDAARFGARPNVSGVVVLENVSANTNELTLLADLPMSALPTGHVSRAGRERGEMLVQRMGGWLNYTVDTRRTDLGESSSLLTDLNVSMPFGGVLRSLQINGDGTSGTQRLMTNYQLDAPDRMLSLVVGDAYSSSYALAGGQKFLGVQVRKNYALNPDYIYWPTLNLSGTARAFSVYEIFENNRRVGGGDLGRGDFVIEDYSSFVGESGQVKLILRDAQGNEQVIARDLFTAPGSLREGELSYALDAGVAYRDSGQLGSGAYGAGSVRYGFDAFTAEAGGDILDEGRSAFAGIILPTSMGSFNYRHIQGDQDGVATAIDRAGWEKRFVLTETGEARLYVSGEQGSRDSIQIGAAYWSSDWSVFGSSMRFDDTSLYTVGGSWFQRDFSMSASISQSSETGMVVGLNVSVPLGGHATAHAVLGRDRQGVGAYGATDAWRWSAQVANGEQGEEAVGSLRRDFGPVMGEVYVDHHYGSTAYRSRVLGSVVATPEGVALARPVTSGVLMVDTGIEDVPVRAGGRTHESAIGSKTVVTNLPPYFSSLVRPDFEQLDGGYTATTDQRVVRIPQGVSEVAFDVRKPGFFADLLHRGQPIERGVRVQADGEDVIVASSGAYIQPRAHQSRVLIEVGECQVAVQVPEKPLSQVQVEVCPPSK